MNNKYLAWMSWAEYYFASTKEDEDFIIAVKKLISEYDVRIGPRGGLSKRKKKGKIKYE